MRTRIRTHSQTHTSNSTSDPDLKPVRILNQLKWPDFASTMGMLAHTQTPPLPLQDSGLCPSAAPGSPESGLGCMGPPTLMVLTWSPVTRPHLQKRNSLCYVETVGYLVVLVYMCLSAVSDVIADIQAVVEF